MNRLLVVAFVVLGLVAAGQAQEAKEKAKEPVKKAPTAMVKQATTPATKEAAVETAGKTTETVKKEAAVKTGEAAGAVHEMGKVKKVHHHMAKKGVEAKDPKK